MTVIPSLATGVTGRLLWTQAGEYDAVDDRAVIAALADRTARVVQRPTLASGGGLAVQVGQWLAIIDAGDGTDVIAHQRMSEVIEVSAGGSAARTDVVFAEIDLINASWELKLYSPSELAGKLGIELGRITVPQGATQASQMTFTRADRSSIPRGILAYTTATGPATHTAGSFADSSTSLSTTVTTEGGRTLSIRTRVPSIVVNFTTGAGVAYFQLSQDNQPLGPRQTVSSRSSGSEQMGLQIESIARPVAGSHTYGLRWWMLAATNAIADPSGWGMQLIVEDIGAAN